MNDQKRKYWNQMIWISAISLVLSTCAAIATPLILITSAFDKLGKTGAADPNQLAGDISTAMIGGLITIPFIVASLILFIIAIFRHRKFSNPTQAG